MIEDAIFDRVTWEGRISGELRINGEYRSAGYPGDEQADKGRRKGPGAKAGMHVHA